MTPERWLLAACAALFLPHFAAAMQEPPIVVRLGPPPAGPSPILTVNIPSIPPPPVTWAVPRYALTESEREIVAACLVLEAANQGDFGMRSVMSVIRNRARGLPELFAPTVLRPKQFSALNQLTAGRETVWRIVTRAKRDVMWSTALRIVDDAVHDTWHDPTDGATHYTRTGERTSWTRSLAKTVTIGAHSFYR